MKILITGAAGFIGTKLADRLVGMGHEVFGLDKVSMEHLPLRVHKISCDIRLDETVGEVSKFLRGEVDACVHLAAVAAPRQAEADPSLAWETNVRGTQNVLMLCRSSGIKKVVFASSAHVYGISPKYLPTDEEHPLSLLDTYTVTKIMGEKLCQLHHDNYGLSTTVLRLFNAYGPGQSKDYFLGVKLAQAAAGGPVTIMNGSVTKDWVWIDDVVSAMVLALATKFVGPLNIGTGVETSLREMALQISTSFDRGPLKEDVSQDFGPTRMCCDYDRAEDVLGWMPTVFVPEGLKLLADAARATTG